jgi:peptidoglycan/LPS O-acetylase OafA/YrhL
MEPQATPHHQPGGSFEPRPSGRGQARPSNVFFTTLDGIRGLAALLVVVRHTGALVDPVSFQESYLAVDVFFVLSGVVITQAYEQRLATGLGALRFAWLRIVRIYPLYVLGGLIAVLTILAGIDAPDRASHLATYALLGLFLLPNAGVGSVYLFPLVVPSWSLFLELAVNIFYAVALRVLTAASILLIMLAAAIGLVVALHLGQSHSLNVGFRYRGFPFGLCRVSYSFFAGVLIYRRYAGRQPPATPRAATLQSGAIIAAIGAILIAKPPAALQPFYDFAAVTVVLPPLVYAALWVQPAGAWARVCRFLGAISYAVYALHDPLADLIQDFMRICLPAPVASYAPWSGIVFLLVLIPVCWAIHTVYDAPVRRRLLAVWPARPVAARPPAAIAEDAATAS